MNSDNKNVLFGCIADDFTGATDIAGILARSGVRVNLRIGVPNSDENHSETEDPQVAAPFEIIALKCRSAKRENAIEETLRAFSWLQSKGARRYFWKYCSTFDSTAEGNIGPVSEALMQALQTNQTIYCPAFPENGRSIYKGMLFVGDQPLHESSMKDHPLTPMLDSNLKRLLEPQVSYPVGNIYLSSVREGANCVQSELAALEKEGIKHVITDAIQSEDLATLIAGTAELPLLTGGSALALHLPALYQKLGLIDQQATQQSIPETSTGQIVLSGSCSEMTRSQVSTYKNVAASLALDPIALAKNPAHLEEYIDWINKQPIEAPKLIYATSNPDKVKEAQKLLGKDKAGELIETTLAHLAEVAFNRGIRRFVIAGGETSGAVSKRLGITKLSVGQEISPGVPWTYCERQGDAMALALKSGNFGDAHFFSKAMDIP